MTRSEQGNDPQERAGDLESCFEAARDESGEKVRARVHDAKAAIADRQEALDRHVAAAADHAKAQWASVKSDTAAKMSGLRGRTAQKREEHDVKTAEKDAEHAEDFAADSIDFDLWAIDQGYLAWSMPSTRGPRPTCARPRGRQKLISAGTHRVHKRVGNSQCSRSLPTLECQ